MTPEEERFWRIIAIVAILAAVGAFRPQIMKWWRKIGYRSMNEKKDP